MAVLPFSSSMTWHFFVILYQRSATYGHISLKECNDEFTLYIEDSCFILLWLCLKCHDDPMVRCEDLYLKDGNQVMWSHCLSQDLPQLMSLMWWDMVMLLGGIVVMTKLLFFYWCGEIWWCCCRRNGGDDDIIVVVDVVRYDDVVGGIVVMILEGLWWLVLWLN